MSRANLSGQQRHHGHGLPIQGRQFDLITTAAPMNEHNPPDVATPQVCLGRSHSRITSFNSSIMSRSPCRIALYDLDVDGPAAANAELSRSRPAKAF